MSGVAADTIPATVLQRYFLQIEKTGVEKMPYFFTFELNNRNQA
jgi:hypothetical protein